MGAIIMILLNAILLKMAIPDQISDLEIFNPVLFAASNLCSLHWQICLITPSSYFFWHIFSLPNLHCR